MSGICGIVTFDGTPVDARALSLMAEAAAYRGTDGIRYWCNQGIGLGNLACTITPESLREEQPLTNADGSLVLTADARIDNREDLIRTLSAGGRVPCIDPTDAELILAAYERWGRDCPGHLIGDFAFAIWDEKAQALIAARDPMGMRSLCYRLEPRQLLFATEASQILELPSVPARIFEPAVCAHLAGPYVRPEWTFYEGIDRLPPAHALEVTRSGCRAWRYWDIDPASRIIYSNEGQYAEHLRDLFTEAVRCRVRSVKPVGIMLSGGMDSGSVASVAGWLHAGEEAGTYPLVRAYSWAFKELRDCDERHISSGITQHYGIPETGILADNLWPLRDYPRNVPDRDDPFIWPYEPLINQTLAAAQSDGTGLVMTGERGDEMVGAWIFDHCGLFRAGRWRTLASELVAHSRRDRRSIVKTARDHLLRHLLPGFLRRTRRGSPPPIPAWIRPEFARRVGLTDIMRECRPRPHVTGAARRDRYRLIFSYACVRIVQQIEQNDRQ